MNVDRIVTEIYTDLEAVANHKPNERLPKEEQMRCRLYASLRSDFDIVCAERGYTPVENGKAECDIYAETAVGDYLWIELKRAWHISGGWTNKPPEQRATWEADVNKLKTASKHSDRYFLLVGFFDRDPIAPFSTTRAHLANEISTFYQRMLVHKSCRPFTWRANDGITHIGIWVWKWPTGSAIK